MSINPKKLPPQVSTRAQLFFAALLWLVGAGMILRLGMIYLGIIPSDIWWVPPLGLALGLLKAYFIMIPSAARSTERIRQHGKDWILNCFSPKTYLMIGGMITLGIVLRTFGPNDALAYQIFLASLYLTVGVGLFISLGTFLAALRRITATQKAAAISDTQPH